MSSTYIRYPQGGSGGGVNTYANLAAFPSAVSSGNGALAIALDTNIMYESNGATWVVIASPSAALSLGNLDAQAETAQGAALVSGTLSMQSADLTHPGLVNTTTQTFGGNKTFNGTIGASNLSGTNTGDVTLGLQQNGLSLASQVLSFQTNTTPILPSNYDNTSSITSLNDQLNCIISAGMKDGGVVTDNGNGTINITAGTAYVKTARAVNSITRSGTTATVTTAVNHGFTSGSIIYINGATVEDYNGPHYIVVTGLTTFTYMVMNSPATPAVGTIYATSDSATVNIVVVPAATNVALTDHATNYVFANFLTGTPSYVVGTSSVQYGGLARPLVWIVAREGNQLWLIDMQAQNINSVNKTINILGDVHGIIPKLGTAILSATGTRNFAITAGKFYLGLAELDTPSFDTSGASTFTYAYTSNSGTSWTYVASQTAIDNTQYNAIGSGLANLTTGNYGVHWVYVMNNNPATILVVYGQNDYSYADAFLAQPPTVLPPIITNVGVLVGRIIIKNGASVFTDITSAFTEEFPNLKPVLNSLTDVNAPSPNSNDVLTWNGALWVNAPVGSVSAGAGVNFYDATPTVIATGTNNANLLATFSKVPITTAEQTRTTSLTNNTLLAEAFVSAAAAGRTSIDAGLWTFNQYAGVNSVAAGRVTTCSRYIYQVIPGATGGFTVTTTGSGTSRTATASGSSFVAGDASATITVGGYLQTPQGLFKISAYTSATVVTIVTLSTYVNESAVQFYKWSNLFGATSAAITSISPTYSLNTFSSTQAAFSIAATDYIGSILFGTSNNTVTLTNVYNGTTHSTFMSTPLVTRHNDLAGLQGGTSNEYYHLTSAQTTVATQAATSLVSGYLSNTDWSSFNNKQGAGNYITALTSDVTATGPGSVAATIANNAVTNAKAAQMAAYTLKGNNTGSTANSADLTMPQSQTMIYQWLTSTAYVVGNKVTVGTETYVCIVAHTSGTWATDVAAGKWNFVNVNVLTENIALIGNNFEDNSVGGWTGTGCATVTNGLPITVGSGGNPFSSSNGGRALGANTTAPAVTATTPINGLYSLNFATSGAGTIGDGYISQAYTVSSKYQAKVLRFQFSYFLKTAPASYSMAGTSANTWAVAIYSPAENAWLSTAGQFNIVQSVGVGICNGTVLTTASTTSVQIFIYNPVAPTAASSFYIDDVYIGPQVTLNAPSITDWAAYTPSIGAWAGNVTPTGFWRRVGDSIQVKFNLAITGAPTGALTDIYLPSGVTIDTTKLPGTQAAAKRAYGSGYIQSAANGGYPIYLTYSSTTSARPLVWNSASTYVIDATINATVPGTFANGDIVEGYFEFPISGWSSNSVMSNDTDTRPVALSAYRVTSNQTGVACNNSAIKIALNSTTPSGGIGYDNFSSFDTVTTNLYTIPVTGYYKINGSINVASTNVLANLYQAAIFINGSQTVLGGSVYPAVTTAFYATVTSDQLLTAGTTVGLYLFGAGNNSSNQLTVNLGAGATYLNITRVSGPAVIAAADTVAMKYTNSAGTTISTVATVPFPTKVYDTTNSFNTSTNQFVAPISGKYRCTVLLILGGATFTTSQQFYIDFYKNGSLGSNAGNVFGNGTSQSYRTGGSTTFALNAGDTLEVKAVSDVSNGLASNNAYNYFCVERIGN